MPLIWWATPDTHCCELYWPLVSSKIIKYLLLCYPTSAGIHLTKLRVMKMNKDKAANKDNAASSLLVPHKTHKITEMVPRGTLHHWLLEMSMLAYFNVLGNIVLDQECGFAMRKSLS